MLAQIPPLSRRHSLRPLDPSHTRAARCNLLPRARAAVAERLERRVILSDVIPVGPEILVSYFPGGNLDGLWGTSIGLNGDFVVRWSRREGSMSNLYAKRYNAAGVPQGSEFRINASDHIAIGPDGGFIIAMTRAGAGSGLDVYAQRYDAAGTPHGDEFRVNTHTTGGQGTPSVAIAADGDFVIAWNGEGQGDSSGIFAQRYSAAGVAQGSEFRVNTWTTGNQHMPSISTSADGFSISWSGDGAGGPSGLHAQRYDVDGMPQGSQFSATGHALTIIPGKGYATSWTEDVPMPYGFAERFVRMQMFDRLGQPKGPPVVIRHEFVGGGYGFYLTGLAASTDGVVALLVSGFFDPSGSFAAMSAKRFDSAGVLQGTVQVAELSGGAGWHGGTSVAVDADGDFVAAWDTEGPPSYGVYARRFAVVPEVTSSAFLFDSSPHRLRFNFSRDVRDSLSVEDLVLQNLTTGQTIPSNQFALLYDDDSDVATFLYLGQGSDTIGGVLPDGEYRASLFASGIVTPQGAPLAEDLHLDFFFLNGDANRDGRVNLRDFNVLAQHFGQSGTSFGQADFTYDGTTDLEDFNVLALRFGRALEPPAVWLSFASWRSFGFGADDDDPFGG